MGSVGLVQGAQERRVGGAGTCAVSVSRRMELGRDLDATRAPPAPRRVIRPGRYVVACIQRCDERVRGLRPAGGILLQTRHEKRGKRRRYGPTEPLTRGDRCRVQMMRGHFEDALAFEYALAG